MNGPSVKVDRPIQNIPGYIAVQVPIGIKSYNLLVVFLLLLMIASIVLTSVTTNQVTVATFPHYVNILSSIRQQSAV